MTMLDQMLTASVPVLGILVVLAIALIKISLR